MDRTELDPRAVARVIAAYGFEAVRGRSATGSGAAPAHRIADLRLDGVPADKRTVAKKATAGFPADAPAHSTATPFDYAMAAQYDWSRNGGQASFEAALSLMAERFVPLDPEHFVDPAQLSHAIAAILRVTVQSEFDDPDTRLLTVYAIEAMALDYIRSQEFRKSAEPGDVPPASNEALAWARWLVEQRRTETRQTTQSYEAVLSFCLLMFRRRPKPGYSVPQIVRATQSLWTGGMLRAFLHPEDYPEYGPRRPLPRTDPLSGLPEGNGQIEGAMVDLIIGMTEASLFSFNEATVESRVVIEALHHYRSADAVVSLRAVTAADGVDDEVIREQFPTDHDLASACLRWLAGTWSGFDAFADQFREAAIAGVEALLEWVAGVRRDFPVLLDSAGFAEGDPAFDEVAAFVANVLSRKAHGTSGVPSPDEVKWARRCVEDAANGGDWRKRAKLAAKGTPARGEPGTST